MTLVIVGQERLRHPPPFHFGGQVNRPDKTLYAGWV